FKEHPVALGSPGQGCVFYAFLFSRQVIYFKVFLFGDFVTTLTFSFTFRVVISALPEQFCRDNGCAL
ncbi:hypothetical protein MJ923_20050, partial [Shewanella sp. 3B26]